MYHDMLVGDQSSSRDIDLREFVLQQLVENWDSGDVQKQYKKYKKTISRLKKEVKTSRFFIDKAWEIIRDKKTEAASSFVRRVISAVREGKKKELATALWVDGSLQGILIYAIFEILRQFEDRYKEAQKNSEPNKPKSKCDRPVKRKIPEQKADEDHQVGFGNKEMLTDIGIDLAKFTAVTLGTSGLVRAGLVPATAYFLAKSTTSAVAAVIEDPSILSFTSSEDGSSIVPDLADLNIVGGVQGATFGAIGGLQSAGLVGGAIGFGVGGLFGLFEEEN